MNDTELDAFLGRYLAMWHEPDAARRRALVEGLWAADGENYTRSFVVRGIDEMVARVARSHGEWVASKGFVFRRAGRVAAHHHVVKFGWEMVPRAGGPVEARGLDVFVLRDDGRIASLYQFNEPTE